MRLLLLAPIIGFFLIASFTPGRSQENVEELWAEGQAAYHDNDYAGAAIVYQQILSHDPGSHVAMYNLGNSFLMQQDPGRAILWYERALRIKPLDLDTRHNLAIARARREQSVVEMQDFFLVRWSHGISSLMSPAGWGGIGLVVFWAGCVLIIRSIRTSWTRSRTIACIGLGVIFLLTVLFGFHRKQMQDRQDVAIVLDRPVAVRIAPEQESKEIVEISPGEKVFLLDSLSGFYKIRLVNFEQGWIPVTAVERI